MTDIAREKYLRLMSQVAELEDEVSDLEAQLADPSKTEPDTELRQELKELQEALALKKSELARISDGCGYPRTS
jgi:hypothetical protein